MVNPPNFRVGVGRLTTDRFDFQNHVDGYSANHKATTINLNPSLTIDGYTATTVQDAFTYALPFLANQTIPDATTISKGLVQLTGDIAGTATNVSVTKIRGRSVSTAAPSTDNVLTWDAGSFWKPAAIPNASETTKGLVQLAGDLSGTATNVTIGTITGVADEVDVNCTTLGFGDTLTPMIMHLNSTGTTGDVLTIKAQTVSGASGVGGKLALSSGYGSSRAGIVSLQLPTAGSTIPMVQVAQPTASNSVLALVQGTDITSTQMPANSGNRVIYIADAASIPAANPITGCILYSTSGKLWARQSDGYQFRIGQNIIVSCKSKNEPIGYDGSWSAFASVTDANYASAFALDDIISVLPGDIVNVSFSGLIGHPNGFGAFTWAGYIKLIIIDDLISGDSYDIPGTEVYVAETGSITPRHMTITGSYVSTASMPATLKLMIKSASGMSLYGGASLRIEIIRPQ